MISHVLCVFWQDFICKFNANRTLGYCNFRTFLICLRDWFPIPIWIDSQMTKISVGIFLANLSDTYKDKTIFYIRSIGMMCRKAPNKSVHFECRMVLLHDTGEKSTLVDFFSIECRKSKGYSIDFIHTRIYQQLFVHWRPRK